MHCLYVEGRNKRIGHKNFLSGVGLIVASSTRFNHPFLWQRKPFSQPFFHSVSQKIHSRNILRFQYRFARFFLVQNTKTGKLTQNLPNVHRYTNIFNCKNLQNLPKFGFLVSKRTIWQPCSKNNHQKNLGMANTLIHRGPAEPVTQPL
jgi:hypothetical protein